MPRPCSSSDRLPQPRSMNERGAARGGIAAVTRMCRERSGTGGNAVTWCWRAPPGLDPAVAADLVPHVAQPVLVRDDAARQDRIEVPEHEQHPEQVRARDPGADRAA